MRDAHNNLLEPTPESIPSAKRSRHSSEKPSPSSQVTKGQKRRATLGIREKKVKKYGRTSHEGRDFCGRSEDELGGTSLSQKSDRHTILYEDVQDDHTPSEDSAAASRVDAMLNDYRGPEIAILSSGGVGKHFSIETSVQQIVLPPLPTVNWNIPTQQSESSTWPTIPNMTPAHSSSNGRAATHNSNADIASTREPEEATSNGQTTSEANRSSGSNKTTSLSQDNTDPANIRNQAAFLPADSSTQSPSQTLEEQETSNLAVADELGSDDPAIGLPKDQYQPRPSRSRGNPKENDLLIPEDFSRRPEALVREKRKAKNRRKTTALERPTPKIEVEDEDEDEVKVPLVAVPKLPPRQKRGRYPENDESDYVKSRDKGLGQAIAVDQENNKHVNRVEQEAKERKEVVPASPSPKKRGRGRPKKQAIQPVGDIQDFDSGDEAGPEPIECSTKPRLAQSEEKRKSRIDHASPADEHGEASGDDQEAHQTSKNGNDDTMSAPSDNEPDQDIPPIHEPVPAQPKSRGSNKRKLDDDDDDNETVPNPSEHDDTATDTAQPIKAPPKKRGRKKKTDPPATSASTKPLDQEDCASEHPDDGPEQNHQALKALSPTEANTAKGPTISPTKIATPPTTPPKAARPVHSPITSSTVKFRVGLSKKVRIAPLLKIVRKGG